MLATDQDKLRSFTIRGHVGFPAGAGFARCGNARCGAPKDFGGIYQRKKTLIGWQTSRMRAYRPTNPRTPRQQAWRAVFTAGWTVYNSLTPDEKAALIKTARKYRLSGHSYFIGRYLSAHKI